MIRSSLSLSLLFIGILIFTSTQSLAEAQRADPPSYLELTISPYKLDIVLTTGAYSCWDLDDGLKGFEVVFEFANGTVWIEEFREVDHDAYKIEFPLIDGQDYVLKASVVCQNSSLNSSLVNLFNFTSPFGDRANPPQSVSSEILSRNDVILSWESSSYGCSGENSGGDWASVFVRWSVTVTGFECPTLTDEMAVNEILCTGTIVDGVVYNFSVSAICDDEKRNSPPYLGSFTGLSIPERIDPDLIYHWGETPQMDVTTEFAYTYATSEDCMFFDSYYNKSLFELIDLNTTESVPFTIECGNMQSCDINAVTTPGKTYRYTLQIECENGMKSEKSMATFTVPNGAKADPILDLAITNLEDFSVSLEWLAEDTCERYSAEFDGFNIIGSGGDFKCGTPKEYIKNLGTWEVSCNLLNESSTYTFAIGVNCTKRGFNSDLTSTENITTPIFTVFQLDLLQDEPNVKNETDGVEVEKKTANVTVVVSPFTGNSNYSCEELGSKTTGMNLVSDEKVYSFPGLVMQKNESVTVTIEIAADTVYDFTAINVCEDLNRNSKSVRGVIVELLRYYPSAPQVQFESSSTFNSTFNITKGMYDCTNVNSPSNTWTFDSWDSYLVVPYSNENKEEDRYYNLCKFEEDKGVCDGLESNTVYQLHYRMKCRSNEFGTRAGYWAVSSFETLGKGAQIHERVAEGTYQFDFNGDKLEIELPKDFVLPANSTGLYFSSDKTNFNDTQTLSGFTQVKDFFFEISGYSTRGQVGGHLSTPLVLSINITKYSVNNPNSLALFVYDDEQHGLYNVLNYCDNPKTSYNGGVWNITLCHFSKFYAMTNNSMNATPSSSTRIIDYVVKDGGITGAGVFGIILLVIVILAIAGAVIYVIIKKRGRNNHNREVWLSMEMEDQSNSPVVLLDDDDRQGTRYEFNRSRG